MERVSMRLVSVTVGVQCKAPAVVCKCVSVRGLQRTCRGV
jgi:hypothetical protein